MDLQKQLVLHEAIGIDARILRIFRQPKRPGFWMESLPYFSRTASLMPRSSSFKLMVPPLSRSRCPSTVAHQ